MNHKKINTVLFDLDGTLIDTAPDLAHAMNETLKSYDKPLVTYDVFRRHAGLGATVMIKHGFQIEAHHPEFEIIKEKFLKTYEMCLTHKTDLFDGMNALLNLIEEHGLKWGVVTNKPEAYTSILIEHFKLTQRVSCVVSGDTLAVQKPHPEPLLFACQQCNTTPDHALYVGDTHTDIIAAKAAGLISCAVSYGYAPLESQPESWEADFLAETPMEIWRKIQSLV